jgi:hypothetical protein
MQEPPLPEASEPQVLFKKITSFCPLKSESPVNTWLRVLRNRRGRA